MEFSAFRNTGELSDITIVVDNTQYNLHKFPLYIKSDFFRSLVKTLGQDSEKVELAEFPGGAQIFELIADYFYNIDVDITRENVCKLRCAAEFLQMNHPGNLSERTDKFLQDTLTAAKLGRNLGPVVELLLQCKHTGAIAEETNIVDRCIDGIIECWLTQSSKFVRKAHSGSVDQDSFNSLVDLPLSWFVQLFIKARDKHIKPAILVDLVQIYVTNTMEKYKNDTNEMGKAVGTSHQAKNNGSETESKSKSLDGKDSDQSRLKEVMDVLLLALPEKAPLATSVSPKWAVKMLKVAEELKCESRGKLLQLCGDMLDRLSPEDLVELPADLICEILKSQSADGQTIPESKYHVIDNYLSELADKGELSPENYKKMIKIAPLRSRNNHDALFQVTEKLLQSHKDSMPEGERQELLDLVDCTRLSENTLQRAYDGKLVPIDYITKAALALCAKLRSELDTAKVLLKTQEDELQKFGFGKTTSWSKNTDTGGIGPPNFESTPSRSVNTTFADVDLHRESGLRSESLGKESQDTSRHSYDTGSYSSSYRSYLLGDRDSIDSATSDRYGDYTHRRLGSSAIYRPLFTGRSSYSSHS